jgi:flagellar biosynthesis/type III secretory pathway protein FliH
MSDSFVPLALFLRPESPPPDPLPQIEPVVAHIVSGEHDETLRAARRFRAGLADVLDAALPQLLESIARDVLARELRLAGADVAALVEAALDRFGRANVLRVRGHPCDLAALGASELDCVADSGLLPGDLFIELQSGSIDLSIKARLDGVLRAWA